MTKLPLYHHLLHSYGTKHKKTMTPETKIDLNLFDNYIIFLCSAFSNIRKMRMLIPLHHHSTTANEEEFLMKLELNIRCWIMLPFSTLSRLLCLFQR